MRPPAEALDFLADLEPGWCRCAGGCERVAEPGKRLCRSCIADGCEVSS